MSTSGTSAAARVIRVSALVLQWDEAMLMVRKRGTTAYMLPGGKPEPGELPIDTIIREVEEELGLHITRAELEELGTFTASAANEAGHRVVGDVFVHRGMPEGFDFDGIRPQAEIESLRWFAPDALPDDSPDLSIAPLTRLGVVPALAHRSAASASIATTPTAAEAAVTTAPPASPSHTSRAPAAPASSHAPASPA